MPSNAQSLVRARQEYFGDLKQWYSFKPPGYENVLGLDPFHQCAWQVLETNAAIEEGLAKIICQSSF